MPGTKRALFLDWGGTLAVTKDNQTLVDAAGNPILTPNAGRVLARERPRFDVCFIVSNQPRVATGEISVAEVDRRVAWANERLGRPFTDWRLCPHTDEDGCDCRKPKPGMFLELARLYRVDLAGSAHVGDGDLDSTARARARAEGDAPALGRVFHGVVHEVDEDLSQPITVGEHRRQVRRELATEGYAAALGLWVDDRQHRLGDLVESRRGELQRHPAELDVGEVGQVVEEAAEALGVTEDDLEEPSRVLPLLEGAREQRLEITVDRGQRGAQLVGDVGHELGADLLESA